MGKFSNSLQFRIQALSIGLVIALSIAFLGIFMRNSKEVNSEHLTKVAERTMEYLNADIQKTLAPAIDMANVIATFAGSHTKEENEQLLEKILKSDPSIFEAYYGTSTSRSDGGWFATATDWEPYNSNAEWDQTKRPWFTFAMQNAGKTGITEPYEDSNTGKICITVVKTVTDASGKIIGVVGLDVFIDNLTKIVNELKITEDGKSYLVNGDGLYITNPDHKKVMAKSILEDLNLDKSILTSKVSSIFKDSIYIASIPVKGTENWHLVSIGSLSSLDKSDLSVVIATIAIAIVLAVIISLIVGAKISGKIKNVIQIISLISKGDLTKRLPNVGNDEIGEMSLQFNVFLDNLHNFIKFTNENADGFSKTSNDLLSISKKLSKFSEETVSQSNSVANTADEMAININAMASGAEEASVNANEVAGAAEQMSANMNTIAAAIEEMSASISQIASNAGDARNVASEATTKAEDATAVMNKLGAAAKEIGQVTDVIKKIADKTNLLALNATIEAASAGEAGKGFAVVAGEIKELANQSAQSADDISRRIEGIQSETGNAVNVIHNVSEIIVKINQSVDAIAGHVSQQTVASNEIASNVAQANTGSKRVASAIGEVAKGANDVSRNAGEAARGAANVSQNVISMSDVARESAQGATQVNQSAGDLSKIASELKNTIAQFKV